MIGEQIATSEKSLATICKGLGLSVPTVRRWIRDIPEMATIYKDAKEDQGDFSAEMTIDIADEEVGDMVQATRQKTRIQARQWHASKLKPKTYGDNKNITGEVKVSHQLSSDQYTKLLEAAAAPVQDIDHEEIE